MSVNLYQPTRRHISQDSSCCLIFPLSADSVNAAGTEYRCGQATVMACYINTAVHSDVVPIEDAAGL